MRQLGTRLQRRAAAHVAGARARGGDLVRLRRQRIAHGLDGRGLGFQPGPDHVLRLHADGCSRLRDHADCNGRLHGGWPGLRQSRTAGGASDDFVWSTIGGLSLLLDDGDHAYLYGPSLTPVAQVDDAGVIEYLHGDLLGSVRTITNSAGAVVGSSTFDSFGSRTVHTGTVDSAFGFTGAWTDAVTGLVHLRARDYDPATGQIRRWIRPGSRTRTRVTTRFSVRIRRGWISWRIWLRTWRGGRRRCCVRRSR